MRTNIFWICVALACITFAFGIVSSNNRERKTNSDFSVKTGNEWHYLSYSGAKYATVMEIHPFGDSDIIALKVKIADTAIERIAYSTKNADIHLGERVIVNSISDQNGHGFDPIPLVTSISNDAHGF